MPSFRLPRTESLKSQKRIQALFRKPQHVFAYPFKAVFLLDAAEGQAHPEVLFSVGKKAFRQAVVRNKIKRRMREAYRLHKPLLLPSPSPIGAVGFIYVGKEEADYATIAKGMRRVLEKLAAAAR
jgi:ribonuclease P protein component